MDQSEERELIAGYEAGELAFDELVKRVPLARLSEVSAERRKDQRKGAANDLTDDERAAIALAQIEPRTRGAHDRSYEQLRWLNIRRFNFSNDTLKIIVERAWRKDRENLVKAVRNDSESERIVATDTTDQTAVELRQALTGVVSDVVMLRKRHDESADSVLERLGIACALELGRRADFGESFGIGSGRASQAFAEGLAEVPESTRGSSYRDATIVSLSGPLHPGTDPFFDADQNAMIAFSHLSKYGAAAPRLSQGVNLIGEWEGVSRNSSLHRGFPITPRHAVLGVGVLKDPHRLYRAVQAIRRADDLEAECVEQKVPSKYFKLLDEICQACEVHAESHTTPLVGDISNRLFVVDPDANGSAVELVEQMNGNLLTVSEEKLTEIPRIAIIMTGRDKAMACEALLKGTAATGQNRYLKPNIRMLCVDNQAAEYLKDIEF